MKERIAKYLDEYLRKRCYPHFGTYDPLLFLVSFARGPGYSAAALRKLKKANRFSKRYVEHALNAATYYHEYRHVWDVFTTLHCIKRALRTIDVNVDYMSLLRSLSSRERDVHFPLSSQTDPEIRRHLEKAECEARNEVVASGFSRQENPSLFSQLSAHPERFLPKDGSLPVVGDYVLGARPILETLGQLWGISALAFEPELANILMERIWWRDKVIPESWLYVLILSHFRETFRKVGENVAYGGTIAILDLALQSEYDHPGIRLVQIFDRIEKGEVEWSSSATQFQENLCRCLGWELPSTLLSECLGRLKERIETDPHGQRIGDIFIRDAREFIAARLADPESVLKPTAWENAMVSRNLQRILVEMPSFYLKGRTQVLYAQPSIRTRSYLEYVMLNEIRKQSYHKSGLRCPWGKGAEIVDAEPYDCRRKSQRSCIYSRTERKRPGCLFHKLCDYLGLP